MNDNSCMNQTTKGSNTIVTYQVSKGGSYITKRLKIAGRATPAQARKAVKQAALFGIITRIARPAK
jgi:hypothetical protein